MEWAGEIGEIPVHLQQVEEPVEAGMLALQTAISEPAQVASAEVRGITNALLSIGETAASLSDFSISIVGTYTGGVVGLQHGGIVTRPTLAVVGEAGPEAVIPLDRFESMGEAKVTVNVFNNGSDSVDVDRRVDALTGETIIDVEVARSFRRDIRSNGPITQLLRQRGDFKTVPVKR